MRRRRSAVLRFFFIVFQVIKHLGGYLLYGVLKRLRLARPGRRRGVLREMSRAMRLRLFLQEVDGALLKLGQILAMRVDFLSEEYVQELLKLLDRVPPFSSTTAMRIIEKELGGEIGELFRHIDGEPLASASFGQAYAATLHNGDKVIVKVQRPGVAATVMADLKLFRAITFFVDSVGLTKRSLLRPIYEDFSEWTREELDYRIEGSHVQEIYDKAAGSKTERIPKVYWDYSSPKVLTLERLHGIWVKEIMQRLETERGPVIEDLASLETSLAEVAQNLLQNTLRQIFVYGIYHADPHGGNLLVMKDGVIGYVDFGITGRLSGEAKEAQVKTHVALESGDFNQFYTAIVETLSPPQHANLSNFERVIRASYTDWLNAQHMGGNRIIREKSFALLMLRLSNAAQQNGVSFKSMEVRIFRTLATVDAVMLKFAPNLDARSLFRHFFGAYQASKLVREDIPKLLHKIPTLINMLAGCLDHTWVRRASRVSPFRRGLGQAFQYLSLALFILGLVSLFTPGRARLAAAALGFSRTGATLLLLLLVALFAWLGYLLKLRSVVHHTVIEHHRNTFCGNRGD
ncbi:MAG TPA: AarF/UbiB family protein [Pyrinomonadaceae bacterium]